MSVNDVTERSQTETLAFEVELPHAPEKVWRALTQPELLSQWLLPAAGFELEPGAAFTLRAPVAFAEWDGTVRCRMLEVEPMRKLSYTWTAPFLDTVVAFTLAPTTTGTRLRIVQSGFDETQKREFGGARYGWKTMSGRLVELLAALP